MSNSKNSSNIIESPGRFWLGQQFSNDKNASTNAVVSGTLRISSNGFIELRLDGVLPLQNKESSTLSRVLGKRPFLGPIWGHILNDDKYVILSDLIPNGGNLAFNGGHSREAFIARRCLVSSKPFSSSHPIKFRSLEISLKGFEDWVGLSGISSETTRKSIKALYKKTPEKRWRIKSKTMVIRKQLEGNWNEKKLSWEECSYLLFIFRKLYSDLSTAITLFERIEDLLVLLSDCDRALDFPWLRTRLGDPPIRLYYPRGERSREEVVRWDKAWISYQSAQAELGTIVETWFEKYENYGPGVHLYLGNRRGQRMYVEHRFASMMWGLEALHRLLLPPKTTEIDAKIEEKKNRILDQIKKSSDKRWVKNFLPKSTEPPLQKRIVELLTELPIGIPSEELEAFAKRCADRRNDLSHFGGARAPHGYQEFLRELQQLNETIDIFYHALLLKISNVSDSLIKRVFFGRMRSHEIQMILSDSGINIYPLDTMPPPPYNTDNSRSPQS